ncbi:MAG: MFS transporter [Clostridiales bacterium]|nr:MFS transporter [Roseburia sp.]MDD7636717.1 MFS transporter [Clostridiales bacterium]MDY4111698.1 MFS transporter [Roseburia sp.]
MQKFNIKTQIRRLYFITGIGCFQIAGASWVALLALRGFTILQIGFLESIFHIVSMTFEIPSGAIADVCGRKKTMMISQCMSIVSGIFMILSTSFWTIALAIAINALSYNFASGTREALAYDSLKKANREEQYDHFASTEMMLYRVSNSTATLCAGFALAVGYKIAYMTDVTVGLVALYFACRLMEVPACQVENKDIPNDVLTKETLCVRIYHCIKESVLFIKNNRRARVIIFVNALIGAVATLMLFFLQAKLPLVGLPNLLLGPALFLMGLGAALGSKLVSAFSHRKYANILAFSTFGIILAMISMFTGNPYVMCVGGFVASFSDDFLEVRTDIVLNHMIPSEQRATLVSICSFTFSIVMFFLSPIMGWLFM